MARRPEKVAATRTSIHSKRSTAKATIIDENTNALPKLAKSADPAYTKFTTYIRKATHLEVKTRLVSMEKEMSDLVEELLANWLKENEPHRT
jgi:hypothetical protein